MTMAKIDVTDTKIIYPDKDDAVESLESDPGNEGATQWELSGVIPAIIGSDGTASSKILRGAGLVYTRGRRIEKDGV